MEFVFRYGMGLVFVIRGLKYFVNFFEILFYGFRVYIICIISLSRIYVFIE